jgi:hypothetical protein
MAMQCPMSACNTFLAPQPTCTQVLEDSIIWQPYAYASFLYLFVVTLCSACILHVCMPPQQLTCTQVRVDSIIWRPYAVTVELMARQGILPTVAPGGTDAA